MTSIDGFEPFVGRHCETTATGNLLKHAGVGLSEPMVFGLGEGLAFGVFASKTRPIPFIGGRTKGEEVTKRLAERLDLGLEYRQTRSKARAWANVADFVDAGRPVAAKLDMYFLDYAAVEIHFAAHYVAVHGYDDEAVHVADTIPESPLQSTSRGSFEQARLWRGPMASNALTWTITAPGREPDWPLVVAAAIASNATAYLNPPIRSFGAPGIRKAASLVPTWLDSIEDAPTALAQIGSLMEEGGTGGGLFRRMYAEFLAEANAFMRSPALDEARAGFEEAAALWTQVSQRLTASGTLGEAYRDAVEDAAALMRRAADIEERAMKALACLSV